MNGGCAERRSCSRSSARHRCGAYRQPSPPNAVRHATAAATQRGWSANDSARWSSPLISRRSCHSPETEYNAQVAWLLPLRRRQQTARSAAGAPAMWRVRDWLVMKWCMERSRRRSSCRDYGCTGLRRFQQRLRLSAGTKSFVCGIVAATSRMQRRSTAHQKIGRRFFFSEGGSQAQLFIHSRRAQIKAGSTVVSAEHYRRRVVGRRRNKT